MRLCASGRSLWTPISLLGIDAREGHFPEGKCRILIVRATNRASGQMCERHKNRVELVTSDGNFCIASYLVERRPGQNDMAHLLAGYRQ